MPAVIFAGAFMLFCLLTGLTDRHPNAGNTPRRVDPMSVPYDANAKR